MNTTILLNDRESRLRLFLLDVAQSAGHQNGPAVPELRFAGGWVRDKLLGFSSRDIDIAINNMTGLRFGRLMQSYLERKDVQQKYNSSAMGVLAEIEANPEKSKHLETVTTRIFGLEIDLVNLRRESYTDHSRNPSMEFGSPQDDALRRDSTINALFYNLSSQEVEDFSGRGLQDLKRGIIKTPMAPLQTFRDDPLRVLRAIRFASRYGFTIDPIDASAMRDETVGSMLQTKISRERINNELTKMLKGPNPHNALSLIDDFGLYQTIFVHLQTLHVPHLDTNSWHKAYDTLHEIVNDGALIRTSCRASIQTLGRLLIRSTEEAFIAWMLSCFVPWGRMDHDVWHLPSKRPPSMASQAAREGLKADNKLCKIVDDAVYYLKDIKKHVKEGERHVSAIEPIVAETMHLENRAVQGTAIRKWGGHWRYSVLFAILTESSEASGNEERTRVLDCYAAWLAEVDSLNLLDADKMKPILNGTELIKELKAKRSGPWMKRALDMVIKWQLCHPDETDPLGAVRAVNNHRKDLGVPD